MVDPNLSPAIVVSSPSSAASTPCRICHDSSLGENLISPCVCSGSVAKVHTSCLEKWLTTSHRSHCEICRYPYRTQTDSKPVSQWLMSGQTQAGLLSDFVCLMLLTPLCIVSIYLCSIAASSYGTRNRWQTVTLCSLSVLVSATYTIWAFLTVRFHIQRLRMWRNNNQVVHLDPNYNPRQQLSV